MRSTKIGIKFILIFGIAASALLAPLSATCIEGIVVAAGPKEGGVTEEEYLKRMIGHRMFVRIICGQILSMNVFPDADISHTMERCSSHDAAKVEQDKDFLKKYSDEKVQLDPTKDSIAKRMGKNFGNYVSGAQADRGVIDVTNHVDAKVGAEVDRKFLSSKGPLKGELLAAVEEKIKAGESVEKTADWVARYLWDRIYPGGDGVILEDGSKGTPLYERGGAFDRGSDWLLRPGNPSLNGMYHKDDVPILARKLEDDAELMDKLRKAVTPQIISAEYRERMKISAYQEHNIAVHDSSAGKSVGKVRAAGADAGGKCFDMLLKSIEAM